MPARRGWEEITPPNTEPSDGTKFMTPCVVLCGVVLCSVVWCCVMLCDVVLCSVVLCGVVFCGVV